MAVGKRTYGFCRLNACIPLGHVFVHDCLKLVTGEPKHVHGIELLALDPQSFEVTLQLLGNIGLHVEHTVFQVLMVRSIMGSLVHSS